MARLFETVGKELDKAMDAIDRAMDDPTVKKGEKKAAEVVDRTMEKVDSILARALVSARSCTSDAKGPAKKAVDEVSKGLMMARDEVQKKRASLHGHSIEDTAVKVLDDVGKTVDRVASKVKQELKHA
jgi:vacuolar-type H+-ATPase subunit H